jgi:hypothetical protein
MSSSDNGKGFTYTGSGTNSQVGHFISSGFPVIQIQSFPFITYGPDISRVTITVAVTMVMGQIATIIPTRT